MYRELIKQLTITGFCIFLHSATKAQNYDCNCSQTFEKMTEKLENNYIAYHLTKLEIEKEYESRKLKYKSLTDRTEAQNCSQVLQDFLAFFKDGHLFVTEYPNFSEEDLARTKYEIKQNIFNPNIHKVFDSDTIEGYWTDGISKFMIIKNQNANISFEYVAVIVDCDDKTKIGEIKFAVNDSKHKYEGFYYTNRYASRYVKVTPYKDNSLLSIWGGITWGRLNSREETVYNPTAPGFKKIDNKNALLTIPSFLIDAKDLNQVLIDNEKELKSTNNLIIDIRGNTGGNGIYFDLLSLYYEKPIHNERGLAIASDDNIDYFEKFSSNNGQDNPYLSVITAMKQNKGKIVPGPDFGTIEMNPEKTNLKKIVILTDRSNISAAETFILHSKAVSDKVITMGDNTGGVVDYNNINLIKLNCEKHGIYFGYPTFTLNDRIITQGYNKTGIIPDIKINNSVKNKIGFVLKYLKNN